MARPVGDRITRHGGDVAEPRLMARRCALINRLVRHQAPARCRGFPIGCLTLGDHRRRGFALADVLRTASDTQESQRRCHCCGELPHEIHPLSCEIQAYQVGVLIFLVLKRHTLDLIAWVSVDPHSVTQSEVSSVGRFSRHLFVVPPGPALPIMSQTGIACRPELDSPAAAAISHFDSFNVTLFFSG